LKREKRFVSKVLAGTLIIAAACLIGSGDSHAAGFATGGVGIKARAMGGSFRGVADDWSAAVYNPAGLAFLEENQLNITVGTYNPRLIYVPDFDVAGNQVDIGFNEANGKEIPTIDNLWPIPSFAGILLPESMEGTAVGLAVYWPHDVNYGWDIYEQPPSYDTDFKFEEENYRTDMDVLDIHPVFARRLNENFSIGGGLSLTNGDLVFRRIHFVENTLGERVLSFFDVYPYDNLVGDLRFEGNGFSFGGNLGLMWKPSEGLSFGVNIQSPITIPLEGNASLEMAWPKNDILRDVQITIDLDFDRDNDFDRSIYGGVNDVFKGAPNMTYSSWALDLELPAQIGAGIGWDAGERFTLAFDAVWTFWSALDDWNIEFGGDGLLYNVDSIPAVTSLSVPLGWDDAMRLSGGAEYWARDNLTLRGGMYWESGVAVDETFNLNFPDLGDRVGVTGGFAYTINERWEVAAAQEIAFFSDRDVASIDGQDGTTTFPGEYSLTRWETLVSLEYRF